VREIEKPAEPMAKAAGLARLSLLLLVSSVGVAAFWHVLYGAGVITSIVVVVEIVVLVVLAFAYAWRSLQ
jgi:predicted membrane channel-forming protein YqfA (hemolysin III family)